MYIYEGGLTDRAIIDIIPVSEKTRFGVDRPPMETIRYNK